MPAMPIHAGVPAKQSVPRGPIVAPRTATGGRPSPIVRRGPAVPARGEPQSRPIVRRGPAVLARSEPQSRPIVRRGPASPARGEPQSRVQKVLSERGIASRRHAEVLISAGRVTSGGRRVTIGQKIAPDAPLEVDGAAAENAVTHRYVLLNKPTGVVSTARDERGRPTVVSLVGARERLYPVGRLDADSEGLLLLTNDGKWAERVLHPRFGHEREYEVEVQPEPSSQQLATLRRGVPLEEGLGTLSALRVVGTGRLRLVLHTGWKRQVRRMCAVVGLRVTALRRVRIGPLVLGTVPSGSWRELTKREVHALAGGR